MRVLSRRNVSRHRDQQRESQYSRTCRVSLRACCAFHNLIASVSPRKGSEQQSPTFGALGTSFMEDSFSTDRGRGGLFRDGLAHYIYHALTLFLLILHQLHFRSPGNKILEVGECRVKALFATMEQTRRGLKGRLWFLQNLSFWFSFANLPVSPQRGATYAGLASGPYLFRVGH